MSKKDLRNFALIWAIIAAFFCLISFFREKEIYVYALVIAVLFVLIALIQPELLSSFYKLWLKVGEYIGGIFSKVIMFILFFCLFTPISLVLNLLGKDLINKKLNKQALSYWINRETQPQSMKNQF